MMTNHYYLELGDDLVTQHMVTLNWVNIYTYNPW